VSSGSFEADSRVFVLSRSRASNPIGTARNGFFAGELDLREIYLKLLSATNCRGITEMWMVSTATSLKFVCRLGLALREIYLKLFGTPDCRIKQMRIVF
jgi:hypothetical protein